eukprot:jgi/Astpho2/9763/Aster-03740
MVAMAQQLLRGSGLQTRTCSCRRSSTKKCVVLVRAGQGPIRAAQQAVRRMELSAAVKPAALAAMVNILAVLPAHAEAGKIFDFNLTLPVMATEFLLCMVFLEKTWFTPVGQALDKRDKDLRDKLGSVKDNSTELNSLQEQAEKVISEARQEAQQLIAEAKAKAQEKQTKEVDAVKSRIDKELASALATLDKERDNALNDLDSQVDNLSKDILARLIPEGVKGAPQ